MEQTRQRDDASLSSARHDMPLRDRGLTPGPESVPQVELVWSKTLHDDYMHSLKDFWSSLEPSSARRDFSKTQLERMAAYLIAHQETQKLTPLDAQPQPQAEDGKIDEDTNIEFDTSAPVVEEIPRKHRGAHEHRFRSRKKKNRRPNNWLKICLTKAFHTTLRKAPRNERKKFEQERTVWRWVRKYRIILKRKGSLQGTVESWVEQFKGTDTAVTVS